MDAKIGEIFGKLHEALDRMLAFFKGEHINTLDVPLTRGDSFTVTLANVQALQRWGYVDCTQRLKGPARFLRLSSTQISAFFLTKSSDPNYEISYREPLAAATYYNFVNEDIIKWRLEPAGYPVTVIWYMSGI